MHKDKNKIREIRQLLEEQRSKCIGLLVFSLVFLILVGFFTIPLTDQFGVAKANKNDSAE